MLEVCMNYIQLVIHFIYLTGSNFLMLRNFTNAERLMIIQAKIRNETQSDYILHDKHFS